MNVNPFPLSRDDLTRNWESRARDDYFSEHCLRNCHLLKQGAQQPEIVERGKVYERTAIGNDQVQLPVMASPLKFLDCPAIGLPIFGGIGDVWNAALLQQLHEVQTAEAQFESCRAGRNLAVGKKRENSFLANAFLKLVLVDRTFRDVDFYLELHGERTLKPLYRLPVPYKATIPKKQPPFRMAAPIQPKLTFQLPRRGHRVRRFLQGLGPVGGFPRERVFRTAEVAERGGLAIDRAAQF